MKSKIELCIKLHQQCDLMGFLVHLDDIGAITYFRRLKMTPAERFYRLHPCAVHVLLEEQASKWEMMVS